MKRNGVVIVDYGMGNLRSVQKAFEVCGAKVGRVDGAGLEDSGFECDACGTFQRIHPSGPGCFFAMGGAPGGSRRDDHAHGGLPRGYRRKGDSKHMFQADVAGGVSNRDGSRVFR